MKEIIVTNQAELDALPIDFDGRIIIKFGTPYNRAVVNRRFKYRVEARENSSVVAQENSSVVARGNSSVEAWGNTQVLDASRGHNVKTFGHSRIVYNPKTVEEYLNFYGINQIDGKVKLYKAVHKRDARYFSDNDRNFEYVEGCVATADYLDDNPEKGCGHGIHVSYKEWAVNYGRNWPDLAIIEVEADVSKIIVPTNNPGKVRTDKVTVIREVPLGECGLLGKRLAAKQARGRDGKSLS